VSGILRHAVLLALAAALSWWLLLAEQPVSSSAERPREQLLPVAVTPLLRAVLEAGASEASQPPAAQGRVPDELPEPDADESEQGAEAGAEPLAQAPPSPELGVPEGDPEADAPSAASAKPDGVEPPSEEPVDEPVEDPGDRLAEADPASSSVSELMHDDELLAEAEREFSGAARRGFTSVLLAAPEDQIEIARTFGEELVLVPRSAIDPETASPSYFRLHPRDGAIERVAARPPLESYLQYRDLFDYEYSRLPAALRELRRSVLSRGEIYLFAALIPAREWAAIIGRRRTALAASGRELDEVRQFTLRYHRLEGGRFDVRVEEIAFADGSRFRPGPPHGG